MKHNHPAIITAVIINQVIGFIWYSDFLFMQNWLMSIGKSIEQIDQANPLPFLSSLVGGIMFCYLVSWLFQILIVDDWLRGFTVGLIIGAGFLVPNLATHYLFMGYGPNLIIIDGMKELISAGVTGIILAVWRPAHTPERA